MGRLRLQVLTPQRLVLDERVDEVVAPIADGWIGVLPGHSAFDARLLRGEIVVRSGKLEHVVATIGGMISVRPDGVTLLSGAAAAGITAQQLEAGLDQQAAELEAVEKEAERHFSRIYRTLAQAFAGEPRGGA